MVCDGGAAGSCQFDQANARGEAKALLVKRAAIAIGHGTQPGSQTLVDTCGNAFEQRLKQVMVGIDPRRVDHANGGIQHSLAGLGLQGADGADAAVDDTDIRPGVARRRTGQAGEDGAGVTYQPAIFKLHVRLHAPRLRRIKRFSRVRFRASCAGSTGPARPSG